MAETTPKIESSWFKRIEKAFKSESFKRLIDFLSEEEKEHTVYPPSNQIFEAFNKTPFNDVKVVIIGQDPYHGPNQAHGLSFSVQDGIKPPPSLRNIHKELKEDLGIDIPYSGNLTKWAEQGVLMLNATLTVRAHAAGSHQKKGWEEFTDEAIKILSEEKENLVFILWGKYAQKKGAKIDEKKHHVIKSAHPSPFAARHGFFGSKPFSKTNNYLITKGIEPIDWSL